ncbi:MAG: PEGA domain-containing protein [Deltaproteobacteria bacterium]|nr:PEGA domain-containing protein [Deltaproteobacteria bacterium]
MLGRTFLTVIALALAASPAFADDPPEIEMDPITPPAPKPPTPTPTPTPTPAGDGTVKKDPAAARKWQIAAVQLVQRGDYFTRYKKLDDAKTQYENAVTAYLKAIEAGDDLQLIVDMAIIEEKLGRSDVAARHLRAVAKNASAKPDVVKKAQAKLDEVATKIGVVTLTVNPPNTVITMNGNELGTAPLEAPLILMPGTYNLSFTAEGYQPKEAELNVEAGSESDRTIELDFITIIVEPPKPKVVEVDLPPPVQKPSKVPLFVGGAATVGFLTAGVVTGILAVGQHGTFVAPGSKANERADAQANGRTLAHVTDAMLAGTLVAGAFTAYWYFAKYKKGPAKPKDEKRLRDVPQMTKVDVLPWVQPDAGGLGFAGSF